MSKAKNVKDLTVNQLLEDSDDQSEEDDEEFLALYSKAANKAAPAKAPEPAPVPQPPVQSQPAPVTSVKAAQQPRQGQQKKSRQAELEELLRDDYDEIDVSQANPH
jgi:hypothetical protein